jgi:hypothetical protein
MVYGQFGVTLGALVKFPGMFKGDEQLFMAAPKIICQPCFEGFLYAESLNEFFEIEGSSLVVVFCLGTIVPRGRPDRIYTQIICQ